MTRAQLISAIDSLHATHASLLREAQAALDLEKFWREMGSLEEARTYGSEADKLLARARKIEEQELPPLKSKLAEAETMELIL